MCTLQFYEVNPLLSSFSFFHLFFPIKRYWVERNTFFFVWRVVTTENDAIVRHFCALDGSEAVFDVESEQYPGMTSHIVLDPDLFE